MAESKRQRMECPSRVFWVGIGCKRGTSKAAIEQAIRSVFQAHNLAEAAIAGIATIDTKADEAGLVEFCRDRHLPLRYFSADVLRSVAIPNPSRAIEAAVGTPSVAEAAALLASWEVGGAEEAAGAEGEEEARGQGEGEGRKSLQGDDHDQHSPSTSHSPLPTPHSLLPTLCIPKQIIRNLGQPGFVTIAVATIRAENPA